ncbi:MAG: GxxExxY protein [Gemmatimonadaceae bacterium]
MSLPRRLSNDAPDDEATCRRVIGIFYRVYNLLGFGFPESVYARALELELVACGLNVVREARMQVTYRREVIGEFRADLLVEDCLILELKAASHLTRGDEFQLVNHLRATGIRLGLLMLFGPRPDFRRILRPGPR